ncbi:hypothetical protein GOZ92_00390 [Agrobacterium vitis]|nr:hypothetical protein [Agrobacterium vitis]
MSRNLMISRQLRNVSLTPELEGFIHASLASGDYAVANDMVCAALETLRNGVLPWGNVVLPWASKV